MLTWTQWMGLGAWGVIFRELPGSALSLKPLFPKGRQLSKSHFCPYKPQKNDQIELICMKSEPSRLSRIGKQGSIDMPRLDLELGQECV